MRRDERGVVSAPLVVSVVIAIAALTAFASVGAVRWLRTESAVAAHDSSLTALFAEAPIANRREAWFRVGTLDIGVVQARPLADGRLGLRVLVLSPDGSGRCCTLATTPTGEIESRPGFESASGEGEVVAPRLEEFTIAVPPGDGSVVVDVVDLATHASTGSFTLDLADLQMPDDPWALVVR